MGFPQAHLKRPSTACTSSPRASGGSTCVTHPQTDPTKAPSRVCGPEYCQSADVFSEFDEEWSPGRFTEAPFHVWVPRGTLPTHSVCRAGHRVVRLCCGLTVSIPSAPGAVTQLPGGDSVLRTAPARRAAPCRHRRASAPPGGVAQHTRPEPAGPSALIADTGCAVRQPRPHGGCGSRRRYVAHAWKGVSVFLREPSLSCC